VDYPDGIREGGASRIHQFMSGLLLDIGYSSKIIHDGIDTLPAEIFLANSGRMIFH